MDADRASGRSVDNLPARIRGALDGVLELFLRDFVQNWYHSLGFAVLSRGHPRAYCHRRCRCGSLSHAPCSADDAFPHEVRRSLMMAIEGFGAVARKADIVALVIYRLAHALIVHMREYRRAASSHLSVRDYFGSLATDAESGAGYLHHACASEAAQTAYLRVVADVLVSRLLPRAHAQRCVSR